MSLLRSAPSALLLAILAAGSTSCRAFLDLEDPPAGAEGATCDSAIGVSLGLGEGPVTVTGSTVGGGKGTTVITPSCDSGAGPERVYAVTAKESGFLTARLTAANTSFDSVLYAATACEGEAPSGDIECANRKSSEGVTFMGGEILSFPVSAGETRFIAVDGVRAEDAGSYQLQLELSDGGDCASPVPIVIEPGTPMILRGDNLGKKDSAVCPGGNAGDDVVYAIRGPRAGGLRIEVTPMGFDVSVFLRTECGESTSQLTCADSGGIDDAESINVPDSVVSADKDLFVWIDGFAMSQNDVLGGPYRILLTPLSP
jgi:hypothetical protein